MTPTGSVHFVPYSLHWRGCKWAGVIGVMLRGIELCVGRESVPFPQVSVWGVWWGNSPVWINLVPASAPKKKPPKKTKKKNRFQGPEIFVYTRTTGLCASNETSQYRGLFLRSCTCFIFLWQSNKTRTPAHMVFIRSLLVLCSPKASTVITYTAPWGSRSCSWA